MPLDQVVYVAVAAVLLCLVGLFTNLRSRSSERKAPADALPAQVGATDLVREDDPLGPIELYFGTPEAPVLSFSRIVGELSVQTARKIDPASSKISRLCPVLQAAPSVLTAGAVATGDYMRVIVNGPLAASADGDSFLPFVRGAKGRIEELARLKDADGLSNLVNAAAVWQIASVVTAQKHLADISQKLDEIQQSVDSIASFLDTQRRSRVNAAMSYLEQAVHAIQAGEFPEAVRHQLEAVERDLAGIQDHLVEELRERTQELSRLSNDEWIGSGEFSNRIKAHQAKVFEVQQQWLLCVRARAANWQVLSAFPGEDHLKHARKAAILESISRIAGRDGLHAWMDREMRKKVSEVNARFNREQTLRERRAALTQQFEQQQAAVTMAVVSIGEQVSRAAGRLLTYQAPITLALRVEQGQVVEAYELEEALLA